MKTVCVIPARYGSQRLAAKPLIPLHGRPLILWVVENALRMKLFDEVIVATDHQAIADAIKPSGVAAVFTDADCPSGTDRIHQAMLDRAGDIIVNLQGDEPAMPAAAVRLAHESLLASGADVSTACVPILDRETMENPNAVKVVRDRNERALYFSRSPIPSLYRRDEATMTKPNYIFGYKHLGLYIYRRSALDEFCSLSPSSLELLEKLEQLRMLEHGMHIQCVTSPADSVGVDVAEDVSRAEKALKEHPQ
ncbi:3-deoxy-manno-octulosonate cytidylyltransferase [soil metagenome]